jgi:hypothetical protein
MMQNSTLYLEMDGQNSEVSSVCLAPENNPAQPAAIASLKEAASEICNVLYREKELRYRLVYYALKNIRLYFASDSMNGLSAQDVIQIVIEKIITGARKWNKSLIPDIKALLFLSIKSFIRNEKRRIKNALLLDFDSLSSELNRSSLSHFSNEMNINDINENIFSADFRALISKLKHLLKKDIYASFVLDEILEGAESNIEIAASLNISQGCRKCQKENQE